jgi:small GTP-binding protein
MGFLISKVIEFFSRSKNNFKIIILGIQNAGKTTILYRLALGQLVKTTPTIGSNVEEINYNNVKFQAWDLGGQENMRSVWDVYYLNTDGVIFVIDSNDKENYEESKNQFYKILQNDTLKNAVILIFANKQDLLTSKKVNEIIEIYELDSIKNHIWHIQPCSANTGEGLLTGIKWLSDQLIAKSNNNFPNNPYVPKEINKIDNKNINNTNKLESLPTTSNVSQNVINNNNINSSQENATIDNLNLNKSEINNDMNKDNINSNSNNIKKKEEEDIKEDDIKTNIK